MTGFDARAHFREIFSRRYGETALIDQESDQALSYSALQASAIKCARELREIGVAPGDRVLVVAQNRFELAVLFFGVWQAGGVLVPVNPQLSPGQIQDITEAAEPKLVLVDKTGAAAFETGNLPSASTIRALEDVAGFDGFTVDLCAHQDSPAEEPIFDQLDPDAVFLRIFTSGSTGAPKGIDLVFNRLVSNEILFASAMGMDEQSRFYNFFPMSYLAGVHNFLLLPLSAGGSVLMGQPLGGASLFGLWEDVRKHGVNTLWFTGAMLSMVLAIRPEEDEAWIADQIRLGLVGMAPLKLQTKQDFEARFGFVLHENFALSETAFLTTQRPGEPQTPNGKGGLLDGVQIDVVDEHRQPIGPKGEGSRSTPGELLVRTPHLFAGYINAAQSDVDNILDDGGFLTGDIGFFEDGQLYVVDRKKDLIIRGGINIAPATVEDAIMASGLARECAVVGRPHRVYGEEVCAVIVAAQDVEPLSARELARRLGDSLGEFQKPSAVEWVDSLPRGLTGKIDKKQVRASLID